MVSLYHVDVLLLQWFTDSTDVGHYKAVLQMAEFLWFVLLAIQMVLVRSMSNLWSNDRVARVTNITSVSTRYTFMFTAVMALGLAALADVAEADDADSSAPRAEAPGRCPINSEFVAGRGSAIRRPVVPVGHGLLPDR
jgi:hypothetical protein